jgi:uncharacterized protein (DUF2252 family)
VKTKISTPPFHEREAYLASLRNSKMARSVHCYVRGNTVRFYDWLTTQAGRDLPGGPPVWICGDCHVGNLGPVASISGRVDIQIRDLDQTVIGNPAHDLIRLGLSLATAARSSDLPGYTTARMMEALVDGYCTALLDEKTSSHKEGPKPDAKSVQRVLQLAVRRRWKNLAQERIENVKPNIPRGDKFWEPEPHELASLTELINTPALRSVVTSLETRDSGARIELLDAAYWVKGCSSLGRLRFALLVGVSRGKRKKKEIALVDIKEATAAAAPKAAGCVMPADHAARVVKGAQHIAPNLGERMLAGTLEGRPVVVRELLPQDLKLEIDQLTRDEALHAARYLAFVVGRAHASQMDTATRHQWQTLLSSHHPKSLDAPSWLWKSVVELLASHEAGYLEHCRLNPPAH